MADEPHAVREKLEVIVQLRLFQHRLGRRINLDAVDAGTDRLERRLLRGLDFGQQIHQFGVGLADDAHAGKIPDIAVIIATQIHRQRLALFPGLVRRRAVEA